MDYLSFNSRDTYLAARAHWSADLQAAIGNVRKAKIDLKEAHRAGSIGPIWTAHSNLRKTREAVEELHTEKYRMKAEAQRQWLAARK